MIYKRIELCPQSPGKDRVRDDGPRFNVSLVRRLGEIGRGDEGPVLVDDYALGME